MMLEQDVFIEKLQSYSLEKEGPFYSESNRGASKGVSTYMQSCTIMYKNSKGTVTPE